MTYRNLLMGGMSVAVAAVALGFSMGVPAPAHAQDGISACLITKTDINPFFVKMKEGAEKRAEELGIELQSFAGEFEGDNEGQIAAIETCMASGADGILLTPSDTVTMVAPVKLARDAGLLVIMLDTPLEPIDAADSTFATDNFEAGRLIGAWAKAKMGDAAADARIGFLNIAPNQPTVGVLRNQGFMTGFGIDTVDISKWGDETDPRIVGHTVTMGSEEGGRNGMETLLSLDPSINLIYTINEPAAAGAFETLKAFGKENDVLVTSVDGGCPGVQNVAEGVIGATSQQYPLLMASLGIEAIAAWAKDGSKPDNTAGKAFFDTGVALVTNEPVDGVPSISVEEGLNLCWG